MTTSVVIPFTSGCEHRARARDYVLNHYAVHHPEWEVVEGRCEGTWSKGAALSDAVSRATGDVFVVADADSFTEPAVLTEAVERATETWVVPHRKVYRLNQNYTQQVLAGAKVRAGRTCRTPYIGVVGGGITVLTREAWETVGGIDPRFLLWGGEDLAFGIALTTLVGKPVRLNGSLWHLWHKPEPKGEKRRGGPENSALHNRYREANGNPVAMRALIDEVREVSWTRAG